ncbi:MAG: PD40 domain-containing protein [Bacteroidetes bacterium]|nr:PD40 domain-containing protein [Bacteroidota bacterium]
MKKYIFLPLLLLIISASYLLLSAKDTRRDETVARIFAEGIVSTEDDEFGETFTPDGKTCYFTKKSPSTLQSNVYVICYSRFKNGKWSEPEIAPFSGKDKDFGPSISPDGSKLFFISNRTDSLKKTHDTDIWMAKKSGDGWTNPENLGPVVNTPGYELGCSVASDGTIYFSTTGISGNPDLYCSKFVNGKYQKPDSLGDEINSAFSESDPFIAPDQSYILFSSEGRPDATSSGKGASAEYQRSDLYISFHKDGKWTKPQNLGSFVNTSAEESSPYVSADGKTLYFTSERNFISLPMKKKLDYSFLEKSLHAAGNGLGDIYQLPVTEMMKNIKR